MTAAEEVTRAALAALEELGDGVALTQNVAEARAAAADARSASGEARAALESLKREGEMRRQRLAAIAEEAVALGGAPRRRRQPDRRTRAAATTN